MERDHHSSRPKSGDAQVRKLMRKLDKLALSGLGALSTEWEQTFLREVRERLGTYGSAFADPEKGALEESLSHRQNFKVVEIRRLIKRREKRGRR